MRIDDFIRLYPRVFHMAADGSWPAIRARGLLSTAALLDAWEVPATTRAKLLREQRYDSVTIEHPELGTAVVRDQRPLHIPSLEDALVDMSVAEWLETLNSRVYFFVQPERLQTLLTARLYRDRPCIVLTLDTASLLSEHEDSAELCAINSGFARPHSKAPRGSTTFQPIASYEHPVRTVARSRRKWDVAELCIQDRVAGVEKHLVSVERFVGGEAVDRLA